MALQAGADITALLRAQQQQQLQQMMLVMGSPQAMDGPAGIPSGSPGAGGGSDGQLGGPGRSESPEPCGPWTDEGRRMDEGRRSTVPGGFRGGYHGSNRGGGYWVSHAFYIYCFGQSLLVLAQMHEGWR